MGLKESIRTYYEFVDAEEYEKLFELFAEDIVYERPGHPDLNGMGDFREFYRDDRRVGESNHVVDDMYRDDNTVVVRGRFDGTLGDESVSFGFADLHEFDEEGKIHHRWTYTDLGTV